MTKIMKHRLIPVLMAIAILPAMPTLVQSAELSTKPAEKKQSPTQVSRCVMIVTSNPAVLPLNKEILDALVRSKGVLHAAADEVFGDEKPDVEAVIWELSDGPNTPDSSRITVELAVYCDLSPDKLLTAVYEKLDSVLVKSFNDEIESLHNRQQAFERGRVRRASLLINERQLLRRSLCEEAGRSDLSREPIIEELRDLEREQSEIEMELASVSGRSEAIQKRIAETKEAKPDPAAQAALDAAEKRLKILSDRYERQKNKQKERKDLFDKLDPMQVPMQEREQKLEEQQTAVENSFLELTAAQAEFERSREQVSRGSHPERLEILNQELAEVAMKTVENESKKQFLDKRIEDLRNLLPQVDKYEREIEIELPLAIEAYKQALQKNEEFKQRLSLMKPPTVTIIGG